ncbi:MAG: fibronectin type III domain-containing protein [Endomicrobia bacterium]|nr:fibronectin type III domain-containing protein [Endomicrobiia bacterium]
MLTRKSKFLFFLIFACQLFSQPNNIDNLSCISNVEDIPEGAVKLVWTYPGPDILPEGSFYYIQYSTFVEVEWSTSVAHVVISTSNVLVNSQQIYIVTGLDKYILLHSLSKEVSFYFRVFISSNSTEEISVSNISTGCMTLWLPYVEIVEANPAEHEGKISLKFYAGDDYINNTMIGVLTGYLYIQYTNDINFVNWSTSSAIKISTHSYPSYIWLAGFTISNLTGGDTYYFRIWSEDELGNLSKISNVATSWAQVDISAPARITSIFVKSGFRHVELMWTLPYEDSYSDGFMYNIGGYIGKYSIRYRNDQPIISNTLWSDATEVLYLSNIFLQPNISTSIVIVNLPNNRNYYFSIKTADDKNNWSLISSSSPLVVPKNSPPICVNPTRHFSFDPVKNTTSTVISSNTVILNWGQASWHAGFSLSDNSYDENYGDYISSYTLKVSTYLVNGFLVNPTIVISSINTSSYTLYNLLDDTTYFWTLSVFDSESISSTTAVFKFVVNSQNTPPRFPVNPIIKPINTVLHTKTADIEFDFKDAYDVDFQDYIVAYRIFISTDQNLNTYLLTIPVDGFLTTSYFKMTPYSVPSSFQLLSYDNNEIYWYAVAYDSGGPLGYSSLSTQTAVASFWLNLVDEPPKDFNVYFPTGTPVLLKNTTFYAITLGGNTFYSIMEVGLDNGEKVFIAKSTPIVIMWQPTSDPDPEDGIYEYAIFISTFREPKLEPNAWRYVLNPVSNAPPFEYYDWFKRWDFFVSTAITKTIEEGTQEGYDLKIIENATYFFRIRALDAPQNLYWIWSSSEVYSPSLVTPPKEFCVDFIAEPPFGYNLIYPLSTINPHSLEGPIYFEWSKPKDPDPYDNLKHYFLSVSTYLPLSQDEWYTMPGNLWKVNVYLENPNISSATVLFTSPKLCPGVTYFWQVHSWGSNEWNFSLVASTSQPYLTKPYGMAFATGSFMISNQKPYKFNLISPGDAVGVFPTVGIKTYKPTFYWEQVYDPDNYNPIVSSYVVIISSFSSFSYYMSFFTTSPSLSINIELNPKTTYFWYVRAYDNFNNWQTPHSSFCFRTVNFEPRNFELVSPKDDEIVLSLNPKFSFVNKGDPDNDILSYYVHISTTSDFSIYNSFNVGTNVGKNLFDIIEVELPYVFEENTKYYWRTVADDSYDGVSTTTIQSFWINSYEEEPEDFDINIVSGVIKTNTLLFSWSQSFDKDPKDYINFYKVIVSSTSGYTVGSSTYVVVLGSTTLSLLFDVSKLQENASYCWWVEAYDKKSNYKKSLSSGVFIVDLQSELPDDIYLITPGSTYTYASVSQPIVLTWTAANRKEWWKDVSYKVYVGKYGEIVLQPVEFSSGPYITYDEVYNISITTSGLLENTTYFWYVIASNQKGQKVSVVKYFFVDSLNDPPNNFELYTPSGTVFTRRPIFSWQDTTDPDNRISHYEIRISTKNNFHISATTTIVVSNEISTFVPYSKLSINTTYYWKIRVYDIKGLWTESYIYSFYVPQFELPKVEIFSPKGSLDVRKPKFVWKEVLHPEPNSYVENYRLKIYSTLNPNIAIVDVNVSTTSYDLVDNLVQNVTYFYSIIATDEDGYESEPSMETFYILPINKPNKIERITYEHQQYKFILYWKKVNTYTNGELADDIKGYNIYRDISYEDIVVSTSVYKFISSTITTYTDFVYFSTYYYIIKVVTYGGLESEPSDVVTSASFGGKIITTNNVKIFLPKLVDEILNTENYEIKLSTLPIEEKEIISLNIISKYSFDVVKNNETKDFKFPNPILLEIDVPSNLLSAKKIEVLAKPKPTMFFFNDIEYIYIPTTYENYNKIKCSINKTGKYVIRNVIYNTTTPEIINIYPKKVFTPQAPDNNKIHFVIANPTAYTPEGEIYDLELRYVSKLKYENNELIWDGRFENGSFVQSGVYIYKIKISDKTFTGTVIVAK